MWRSKIKIFSIPNVLILITILFSVMLQLIPLTNVIGYEFSILTAFYLFLFGGITTSMFLNKLESFLSPKSKVIYKRRIEYLVLIFSPLIISVSNTMLNSVCPIWDGLWFYFVITVPSFLIGIILSLTIFELFNRFQKSIFLIIFLLLCFGPIAEIYSNPQVYFYNPIIGFFPGNIYDEDIPVDSLLIFYRLFNIFFFIGILFFIYKLKKIIGFYKEFTIAISILVAVAFSLMKPTLGFATNDSRIFDELGAHLSTEHFNIIYPKEADKKFAEMLGLHHEYYFEELADYFEFEPDQKITSYIFENDDQKRKLFGAGQADVAKPWMNQIYIELNSFDRSLKHELVHVFAAEFGATPFKIAENFNPAMIEGLAVAVEDNYNDNDVHYVAALAKKFGYEVNIENLFSGFSFFSGLSTLSYIYSGSFIKYLFENYEKEKVLKLYSEIDFQKYFGKDINELSKEYSKFIDSLDYNFNEHKANLYFGRKPLIKRVCPRYTANKLKSAWANYNNKNFDSSLEQFSELLTTTNSYSALLGRVYSLNRLNRDEDALNLLTDNINNYLNTSYLYNIELILADNYLRNDNVGKSDSVLTLLLKQSPSEAHYFTSLNRLFILEKDTAIYKKYITADNNAKWEIQSEINKDTLYLEMVYSLIRLAQSESEKYNLLKTKINKYFEVDDEITGYHAFLFSKLALRYSDFETAKYWAVESVKNESKNYSLIYRENLKIINWFFNFGLEKSEGFKFSINE